MNAPTQQQQILGAVGLLALNKKDIYARTVIRRRLRELRESHQRFLLWSLNWSPQ